VVLIDEALASLLFDWYDFHVFSLSVDRLLTDLFSNKINRIQDIDRYLGG